MDVALRDIHKRYGRVKANDGVSLTLEPGRIYGLLGENGAGKSTLMRVLAGHTKPDRGEVIIDGVPRPRLTPAGALALGVGMLYQDPLDFPSMPLWENLILGSPITRKKEATAHLKEIGGRLGFDLPAETRAGDLTVGERQQLEIVRLLDAGAEVLILDEPTTGISLTQKETLFRTIRELTAKEGRTVVVVTHKIADAISLCDRISIMRRGRMAAEMVPPYKAEEIVSSMFGEEASRAEDLTRPPDPDPGPPLISLERTRLTGDKFDLTELTLNVRPGEVIGLAGLEGSGQELFLRGLAGLARSTAGSLKVGGVELCGRRHRYFRRAGIHYLPASRMERGLFPDLTLFEHLRLAFPDRKGNLEGFYQEQCVGRFNLKAPPETSARTLSGGNQQRLLLSLMPHRPKVLLMEHPTRGLDVGSARQVWEYLRMLRGLDTTVFFSSADLDEIFEQSHRIFVFYNQKLIADTRTAETNLEQIGGLMSGREKAA